MKAELEGIVKSAVEALGLELFSVRRLGTRSRPVIDVRIDRRDGSQVTLEECARVSRAIEAELDRGGGPAEKYVLEVSSPGVERPLRGAADWRRFAGKPVNVKSDLVGGMAEVEIVGIEEIDGREVAVVRTLKGEELKLPLDAVREARLAFNWKR